MRWRIALTLCVVLVASMLSGGVVARATSSYDDIMQPVDQLIIDRYGSSTSSCGREDVSTSYASYIMNSSRWAPGVSPSMAASFSEALTHGQVGITQYAYGSSTLSDYSVTIYWTEDTSLQLWWFSVDEVFARSSLGSTLHFAEIYYDSSCHGRLMYYTTSYNFVNASRQLPLVSYTTAPSNNETAVGLFLFTGDPNYPTGYEGELVPSRTLPAVTYVAMGDSYSSGEGSYNYIPTSGNCHRSTDSYIYYLVNSLSLDSLDFVACSGAVTDDLFNPNTVNTDEDAQIDHLSEDTENVTLTIGGNDMGFGSVLESCSSAAGSWGCSTDTQLNSELTDRLAALAGTGTATINGRTIHSILSVIEAISSESPSARIFIGGYPKLFGSSTINYQADSSAPGGYKCAEFPTTFAYDDTQWLNGWADDINGVIEDAVDTARGEGIDVTYVPPTLFAGHGHCDSSDTYLNWVDISGTTPLPESFHPTPEGQWLGYGLAFEAFMS